MKLFDELRARVKSWRGRRRFIREVLRNIGRAQTAPDDVFATVDIGPSDGMVVMVFRLGTGPSAALEVGKVERCAIDFMAARRIDSTPVRDRWLRHALRAAMQNDSPSQILPI